MGGFELLAVVVFFLIGYWIVDYFWPKKKGNALDGESGRGSLEHGEKISWHETLGVSPDASLDEIRRAYKEKIAQYHPDRVATMGPELQEMATRLTQRINVAYNEAVRVKN